MPYNGLFESPHIDTDILLNPLTFSNSDDIFSYVTTCKVIIKILNANFPNSTTRYIGVSINDRVRNSDPSPGPSPTFDNELVWDNVPVANSNTAAVGVYRLEDVNYYLDQNFNLDISNCKQAENSIDRTSLPYTYENGGSCTVNFEVIVTPTSIEPCASRTPLESGRCTSPAGSSPLCFVNIGAPENASECVTSCTNSQHYENTSDAAVTTGMCMEKVCIDRTKNDSDTQPCGTGECYWDREGGADKCSLVCTNSNHYMEENSTNTCVPKRCVDRTPNESMTNPCGPSESRMCYLIVEMNTSECGLCSDAHSTTSQGRCEVLTCNERNEDTKEEHVCGPLPCFRQPTDWDAQCVTPRCQCRETCPDAQYERADNNGTCVPKPCDQRIVDAGHRDRKCGNGCFLDPRATDQVRGQCVENCTTLQYLEQGEDGECKLNSCDLRLADPSAGEGLVCGSADCFYDANAPPVVGKQCVDRCPLALYENETGENGTCVLRGCELRTAVAAADGASPCGSLDCFLQPTGSICNSSCPEFFSKSNKGNCVEGSGENNTNNTNPGEDPDGNKGEKGGLSMLLIIIIAAAAGVVMIVVIIVVVVIIVRKRKSSSNSGGKKSDADAGAGAETDKKKAAKMKASASSTRVLMDEGEEKEKANTEAGSAAGTGKGGSTQPFWEMDPITEEGTKK